MTAEQAYEKFQVKLNENFETSKVAVDRGRFVLVANESMNKMIENILDRKKDDEIRYIQKILVKDHKIKRDLTKVSTNLDYFPLPENYFDFSSAYSKASQGSCEHQKIDLFEIKDDDSTEIMSDEFNQPSFFAREAPFIFSSDSLVIYKDNFTNEELFLSYYRYPQQIKLLNEDDPESDFDPKFEFEFDDKFVDRIISMAVSEYKINDGDASFQINKQQATQKL